MKLKKQAAKTTKGEKSRAITFQIAAGNEAVFYAGSPASEFAQGRGSCVESQPSLLRGVSSHQGAPRVSQTKLRARRLTLPSRLS
jgi:hypothetical protein